MDSAIFPSRITPAVRAMQDWPLQLDEKCFVQSRELQAAPFALCILHARVPRLDVYAGQVPLKCPAANDHELWHPAS